MLRGLLVFAVTYLLVATRRLKLVPLDRPAGAIIGAVLAVAVGAITPDEAARSVDHTTIILLFAVMGMGAFLSVDGFFDRAGSILVARARTRRQAKRQYPSERPARSLFWLVPRSPAPVVRRLTGILG